MVFWRQTESDECTHWVLIAFITLVSQLKSDLGSEIIVQLAHTKKWLACIVYVWNRVKRAGTMINYTYIVQQWLCSTGGLLENANNQDCRCSILMTKLQAWSAICFAIFTCWLSIFTDMMHMKSCAPPGLQPFHVRLIQLTILHHCTTTFCTLLFFVCSHLIYYLSWSPNSYMLVCYQNDSVVASHNDTNPIIKQCHPHKKNLMRMCKGKKYSIDEIIDKSVMGTSHNNICRKPWNIWQMCFVKTQAVLQNYGYI
jgi:hypothetical protein